MGSHTGSAQIASVLLLKHTAACLVETKALTCVAAIKLHHDSSHIYVLHKISGLQHSYENGFCYEWTHEIYTLRLAKILYSSGSTQKCVCENSLDRDIQGIDLSWYCVSTLTPPPQKKKFSVVSFSIL